MPPAKRPTRAAKSTTETVGDADTGSRIKAQTSAARHDAEESAASSGWPMTPDGRPMAKVEMAASELIPTGQYANIVVGPGRLTVFVDPRDADPFPEAERENVAKAMNLVADLVEVDVIAVQRALVLEAMQNNLAKDKD